MWLIIVTQNFSKIARVNGISYIFFWISLSRLFSGHWTGCWTSKKKRQQQQPLSEGSVYPWQRDIAGIAVISEFVILGTCIDAPPPCEWFKENGKTNEENGQN